MSKFKPTPLARTRWFTRWSVILSCLSLAFICSTSTMVGASAMAYAQEAADTQQPQQTQGSEPVPESTPVAEEPPKPTPAEDARPKARGRVFVDTDNNGRYTELDSLFSGVKISNGEDIVTTNEKGEYEIPVDDDSIIFVIKPNGYRTALDQNKLPKFYYIHKPNGSPQLRYRGSAPTGDLPRSIDFPLYRQDEPESFQIILFGDPQPRNLKEVDYVAHDVIAELIGNSASFGVSLGDLAFDNLETLEPLNQAVALIGLPWYNVIGNHDLNMDSPNRKYVNETFESIYGPTYYSFDYGQVHFLVLDSVDWVVPENRREKPRYSGGFGQRQLEFIKQDLSSIPESQMVVLLMHIPITHIADCQELYRMIEKRPLCVSISAHTHRHQHLFLGEKDGWKGKKPHHHIINVTVSGSWWSGQKDERGIPHTTMADGAPNGYSIMTFDRSGYRLDFRAAGRDPDEQMGIRLPVEVNADSTADTDVWVNVYNGSEKSTVQMSLGNSGDWTPLERKVAIDPYFQRLWELEQKQKPPPHPALTEPKPSSHLWHGKLPAEIKPGTHILKVQTTDRHGRTFSAQRLFRVTGQTAKQDTTSADK